MNTFKLILLILSTSHLSCRSTGNLNSDLVADKDPNVSWSNDQYKGNETFLIRGIGGELAIANISPKRSLNVLRPEGKLNWDEVVQLKSFRGKFYSLTLGPKSQLEIIDPKKPNSAKVIPIPKEVFSGSATDDNDFTFAGGLAMDSSENLFLTVPEKSSIFKFEVGKNSFVPWIDLKNDVSGKFSLLEMKIVDDLLFVAVDRLGPNQKPATGNVAAIELSSKKVLKIIDLMGVHPTPAMDYDEVRKKLWVSCIGIQNQDNGSYERINIDRESKGFLTVDDKTKHPIFEGGIVLGKDFKSIFWNGHTATPARSTHLAHGILSKSGVFSEIKEGPTQGLDLTSGFEDSENLQTNKKRDLVAISFRCDMGMCPRGAGIYLFNGETGMPFQKLYSSGRIPEEVTPKPEITVPFLVDGFAILQE
jgi:hypothetical protein